jgi:hypothetical protein
VHGRRASRKGCEGDRVVLGDGTGDELLDAEPVSEQARTGEGSFHGELLVEQHAGEQGERITREQLVRARLLRQAEGRD